MGIGPHAPPIAQGLYYVRHSERGVIALRPVLTKKGGTCAVTGRPILPGERCLAPLPRHGFLPLRVSFEGWSALLTAAEADAAGAPRPARRVAAEPDPVFAAVCRVLLRQADGLVIRRRDDGALILDLPPREPTEPGRPFLAVVSTVEGAVVQLVPLRYWSDLAVGLPPALERHRRGRYGFLFPILHSGAFTALAELARRARARCAGEGIAPG